MRKYKNKYRIESTRLKGWDYRNPGAYFITICTHKRQHFFGKCKNGKMILSTAGAIVQGFWFEIPKHYDHVELGAFVVMPNHLHGILILSEMENGDGDISTAAVETSHCNVSTAAPIPETNLSQFFSKISPKSGSVSRIIGAYKTICKTHVNRAFSKMNFDWQNRFHDHVIRNEQSLQRISNYIVNNPNNWKEDEFFGE